MIVHPHAFCSFPVTTALPLRDWRLRRFVPPVLPGKVLQEAAAVEATLRPCASACVDFARGLSAGHATIERKSFRILINCWSN